MFYMEWLQEFKAFFLQFLKRLVSKLNKPLGRVPMFSLFTGRRRQKVVLVALVVLATVASSLFLFNSILGQMVFRSTLSSHGAVKAFGVGIYGDSNCSLPVEYIDWGLVEPGLASNVTFYIRNEGNYAVTLFLEAENWDPENASDYLTLKWDYADQIIDPDETFHVTLSLLASSDIEDVSDFSLDVIISGTG